jgi:hypothetical protein
MARRNRRLGAARDRELRAATTLNRALTEAKSRGLARLAKGATAHQQAVVRETITQGLRAGACCG